MILVLIKDNLYKIVLDWGYPFAPCKFNRIEDDAIENYELVEEIFTKEYRVGNKFKTKAYYKYTGEEELLG